MKLENIYGGSFEKIFKYHSFELLYIFFQSVSFAADGVIVKVQKSVLGDVFSVTEYTGLVQPIQIVEIKPEVSAKINKVNFHEGSFVKEGQLLFTLDSSQFSATTAARKADLFEGYEPSYKGLLFHKTTLLLCQLFTQMRIIYNET